MNKLFEWPINQIDHHCFWGQGKGLNMLISAYQGRGAHCCCFGLDTSFACVWYIWPANNLKYLEKLYMICILDIFPLLFLVIRSHAIRGTYCIFHGESEVCCLSSYYSVLCLQYHLLHLCMGMAILLSWTPLTTVKPLVLVAPNSKT